MMPEQQVWDLWYPEAGAQGLPLARARIDAATIVLIHAAPPVLRVEVRSDGGALLASGDGLRRTAERPIARLTRERGVVSRVDVWPESEDIGRTVILPGGEAGVLVEWWNAEDGSEWRWRVEFSNHR